MSLLSNGEITAIANDIFSIISDANISTSITYRMTGTSMEYFFDPSSQEKLEVGMHYAESSVSAFKGSFSSAEIETSGGAIEYGDVKFIITNSSVTGIVSTSDQIYEPPSTYQGGTTYNVVNISRDPLNIAYFIQCRQSG